MDIHHYHNKKSHTDTCWVYTQKGYDFIMLKLPNDDHSQHMPGMPVPEHYRLSCPMLWVVNGWVEEGEGQLSF